MKTQDLKRRHKSLLFTWVSVVSVVVVSCHQSNQAVDSPNVKSVVNGNTTFAFDLYQRLKDRPGNLFFSPYSISSSLAVAYAGARGQTENEIAKTLHFSLRQENLDTAFGALAAQMNGIQQRNRITLATANSLWYQQGYQFTDAFLNLVHLHYVAEASQVNFKHPAQAAGEINKWVEQRTNGKIKAAIEPGQLTPDTRLILCSAIYFKGEWQTRFKTKYTKFMPFYINTNKTVTVPIMCQTSRFKVTYCDEHSIEMLELPYSGNDLSMIILLPTAEPSLRTDEQNGLLSLEQKLTVANLNAWLGKLDRTPLHESYIFLPRFTISQTFNLMKVLKTLGITAAFNENANFSGLDGTTNLFIADVIHKAFVTVDESGTEATASTWFRAKTLSEEEYFKADHPFIFLIREKRTGSILFLGRVVDPTSE